MAFDDGIAYFSGDALMDLLHELAVMYAAIPGVYELRFAIDEGGLKFKMNNNPWTPAMGRVVKH